MATKKHAHAKTQKRSSRNIPTTQNNEKLKVLHVQKHLRSDTQHITTNEMDEQGNNLTYIDTNGESGLRDFIEEETTPSE